MAGLSKAWLGRSWQSLNGETSVPLARQRAAVQGRGDGTRLAIGA